MKVPLKWLEEFVSVDVPVDELAERLTFAGLEVGEVIRYGEDWDPEKIVVADVTAVRPHPDADRLRLVTVDLGGRSLEMVTGAPNVTEESVGKKVAAALVGAKLCDAKGSEGAKITLKPAKIRGVRSEGMVCSERELGLSDEHEGIMFLPGDAPAVTAGKDSNPTRRAVAAALTRSTLIGAGSGPPGPCGANVRPRMA